MPKGRFAPTPSGRMHLGNIFSAFLTWLSARKQGLSLVMRIEDLDTLRTREEYTRVLLDDLMWLGLDWDEGPPIGGPNRPYHQSKRALFYDKMLNKLNQNGLIYPCYCSRAELHAPNAPHLSDGSYIYNGRCRKNSEKIKSMANGRPPAVRALVPNKVISFRDGCQGDYSQNIATECGDFILQRSDGVYAYQLAATADDGAMGVTEVVRGRDLLSSTPRQIWLLETLGFAVPRYCHTPLLLAPGGRRLAKRDMDMDMGTIRAHIQYPEKLLGYLGFLAGIIPAPDPIKALDLLSFFDWSLIPPTDIVISPDLFADFISN